MNQPRLKDWIRQFATPALSILRRAAPVAVACYFVLVVFGLSWLLLRRRWPSLSGTAAVTIAALVSAPLAIALIWHRLTGLKAFGVEVSLAQSIVQTSGTTEMVAAITERQYYSGAEHIIEQIRKAVVGGKTDVLEINLRDGTYWWTTRLYLLAALADDFSTIQAFVFVEDGIHRRFLGFCKPAAVRTAIAEAFPAVAEVYNELKPPQGPVLVSMNNIVHPWVAHAFNGTDEVGYAGKVSSANLSDWLVKTREQLLTDSIDWVGITDSQLLREILVGYREQYVALLRNGRLDRIVNRKAFLVQLADRALKP